MALLDPEVLASLLILFVLYRLNKIWSIGSLVCFLPASSVQSAFLACLFDETADLRGTEILGCPGSRQGLDTAFRLVIYESEQFFDQHAYVLTCSYCRCRPWSVNSTKATKSQTWTSRNNRYWPIRQQNYYTRSLVHEIDDASLSQPTAHKDTRNSTIY